MTVLPRMPPEQTASWLGLLDLYEQLNEGWTLTPLEAGRRLDRCPPARGRRPLTVTTDRHRVAVRAVLGEGGPHCHPRVSPSSSFVNTTHGTAEYLGRPAAGGIRCVCRV
jgi:hypothetical protein